MARLKSVRTATLEELTAVNRQDTPLGRAALVLAGRLDNAKDDAGSAVAALAKELRSTLDAALKNATTKADPLDELREKREARRRGA